MTQTNLAVILAERASLADKGITFLEGNHQLSFLSYRDLHGSAIRALAFLQESGLQPKNELVFQVSSNRSFVIIFWACILGGIIPVPLAVGQTDDHKQKLFGIWPVLSNPRLVISAVNCNKLHLFAEEHGLGAIYSNIQHRIIDEQAILSANGAGRCFEVQENDIAFIQFSSGSTGRPKGVTLTHKNLITNMRAIGLASAYGSNDSMISWMPLTHDMGLIGFHINPLFCGIQQYLIPTSVFIRRPSLWLDKASEYRVTILCSPNFGYAYFLKHFSAADKPGWDLSAVRIIYNGAEPISEKLCNAFMDALAIYGLKRYAMCPVYGLAEASLAVSISGMQDNLITLTADRQHLKTGDRITIAAVHENNVALVNVGRPINDCSLRITDDNDQEVADTFIGHIQIKGDNVTTGYYSDTTESVKVITADGWLRTGDLGLMKDGCLYITGRAKDIFFVTGQNYYPYDIEQIAEDVEGIELNKIAVAGFFNEQTEQEETIAFVFHRGNLESFLKIVSDLRAHINGKTGIRLHRILPVKEMPRTTSGKLQRFRLLEKYRDGFFRDTELLLNKLLIKEEGNSIAVSPPGNELEETLTVVWSKVLGTTVVDVTSSVFTLGGDSLKAAEVSMLLLKDHRLNLPMEIIYEKQTIREQAFFITAAEEDTYSAIPVGQALPYYPVSSAQKRIYYSWELDKTSIGYNIPLALHISGVIDHQKLENAFVKLIDRHDSLRMSFHLTPQASFKINEVIDFKLANVLCNAPVPDAQLRQLVRPFELNRAPLFRATLLHTTGTDHWLFLDFHHIIADGTSVYHFIDELFTLYQEKELAVLPVQYKDYACREQSTLNTEKLRSQEKYWREKLQGPLPILEMPVDHPRPAVFSTEGARKEFDAGNNRAGGIRQLAGTLQCTTNVLMYTIYSVLLFKYTQQDDSIIGIPVAGRRHPHLQHVQGMFVNTLPVRNRIQGDESFIDLVERTRVEMGNALRNQDYPFDALIHSLNEKRDAGRNALFDTMFIYQAFGSIDREYPGFCLSRYFFDPGFAKYDLSLEVLDDGLSIRFGIEYATRLFLATTIERLGPQLLQLIDQVLEDPAKKILDLQIVTAAELELFTGKYKQEGSSYPHGKTIDQLFEEQVDRSPGAVAIEFEEQLITYRQLNEAANRMACLLQKRGIGPESITAILMPRSPELIIAILAVLKSGGAYLPIDTDLPPARVQYLMDNSRCAALITEESIWQAKDLFRGEKREEEMPVIYMANALKQEVDDRFEPGTHHAGNLAYVIYTSGTTGMPKGVMIEHRSLVNYTCWAAENYVGHGKASFPLYTSISFDLTVTSIFTPLITGNTIVIYGSDDNSLLLEQVITDAKTDIIKLTPSHLKILARMRWPEQAARKIKRLIVGGEQLDTRLAKEIHERSGGKIEIYNEYGPTEATVGCMIHRFNAKDAYAVVPIGIAAANTRIYLLDKFLRPVPAGVPGELYIAGECLARGYLFNEEITQQKFISDPFVEGRLMYKTGDMAKWLPEGIIEYIGRVDQQVKINGYRIEPAEIEQVMMQLEGMEEALVIVNRNKKQQQHLYAYYRGKEVMQEATIRNYLTWRLPNYMIPLHFTRVEAIPLTKNGKIDYQSLPVPIGNEEGQAPAAARNSIEALSLQIWEQVLGERKLGIHANFFELGGDSIKAVQISSLMLEKGIVLKAKDILTYHTIEQVAARATLRDTKSAYTQGLAEGQRSLTPIERWFFGQAFSDPHFYNQSVLLSVNRKLNVQTLQTAFTCLVKHHDGLRLNYQPDERVGYYNNGLLKDDFVVNEFDMEGPLFGLQDERNCLKLKSGFNINNSLLIRAAVFKKDGIPNYLFITAHHLVMDGISWRILLEDLYAACHALEQERPIQLFEKTADSITWVEALNTYGRSDKIKEEQAYWKTIDNTLFTIPVDMETGDWHYENQDRVYGELDEHNTAFLLKEAHTKYNTNVPILLNTALALTLRKWTGSTSFVIEQENHGRHLETVDTSRTVGWFTDMYPLLIILQASGATGDHIINIKEQMRKVPANGIGYGLNKYETRQQLTEIRFNYLGQFGHELNNELFTWCETFTGNEAAALNSLTAKLELNLMVTAGRLKLVVNYNTKAHYRQTIEWLKNEFFYNLEAVLEFLRKEDNLHLTPSDFHEVDLDQQELDSLFN